MAEFPDLGKHCDAGSCKELDFLPFNCVCCKKTFCKKHYLPQQHECPLAKENIVTETQGGEKLWQCHVDGCDGKELVKLECNGCKQIVCVRHRHPQDHSCSSFLEPTEEEKEKWKKPKEDFNAAKQKVDKQIQHNLNAAAAKTRGKASATASRVQLMKLKSKAIGNKSLPQEERVYMLVYQPKEVAKPEQAVFVSRNWTIGKAVDAVATLCKVANNNNVASAPKLRLFRLSDGQVISEDVDDLIGDVLSRGTISDGSSLILEYVADSTKTLENICAYNS